MDESFASSSSGPLLLVTGATGKVGRHFLVRFLAEPRYASWRVRALCHKRRLPETPRVESLVGSLTDHEAVRAAVDGVTHVLHLATCKETPEDVIDVTVRGLFWTLEECRLQPRFRRFILVGGDAAMGHFFYPHPLPVTEEQRHSAYPGCYALSKVLEETTLEQYRVQYGFDGCCLRAPWIMEKDDFRYQLSFGDDVFGGPRWMDLVGPERAAEFRKRGTVPVMLDPQGQPVRRNFIHVDDLADAILIALSHPRAARQTFNVCMNEPVDYRAVAEHLSRTRGLPSVDVPTPYHSTWLDIAKARLLLSWRPKYDLPRLIDEAYDYIRSADDPRVVYYPG